LCAGRSLANTDSYGQPDANPNRNIHFYSHTNCDRHRYGNCDSNSHANAYGDCHPNSYSASKSNTNTNGHAETFADAEGCANDAASA
jgi:hypothetical protein